LGLRPPSLHDALPIWGEVGARTGAEAQQHGLGTTDPGRIPERKSVLVLANSCMKVTCGNGTPSLGTRVGTSPPRRPPFPREAETDRKSTTSELQSRGQ